MSRDLPYLLEGDEEQAAEAVSHRSERRLHAVREAHRRGILACGRLCC